MGGFDGGPASRSPPLHDRRGRTLSPIQTLSTAIKSYEPDVAPAADGSFVVAWHEEQFPYLKTVVQTVRVTTPRAK